jgi:thiamine-monophosphate kinase
LAAETAFIDQLRALATHDGARGFSDDAAVVDLGDTRMVITHDVLVEGVHFLSSDPPQSVAWKLVAVNVSDLAAKGARPRFAMMGYTLTGDEGWNSGFVEGLRAALIHFNVTLLGGDTVSAKERSLGLTMIGEAEGPVPSRSGACEGDALFVTGVIGDAGAGLALARAPGTDDDNPLIVAYRRPQPQLEAGERLSKAVSAIMDVSDGLLIDAARLCEASGVAAMIDLDAVPLSPAYRALHGDDRSARLNAATAGDDYQLLFTSARPLPALPCPVSRIGRILSGSGLHLHDAHGPVPIPERLGWEHQ